MVAARFELCEHIVLVKRPQNVFYGWWIVAIGFLVNAMGTGVYWLGFTVFFLPMSRDLEISRAAASLPFTLRGALAVIQSPLVGLLVDRIGPAKVLFLSALLAGLGYLLLSRVNSYALFMVVFLCARCPKPTSRSNDTDVVVARLGGF